MAASPSIKLADFHRLREGAQQSLPDRVLDVLQRSDSAHTARNVAGQLLGVTGLQQIVSPEVTELLEQVEFVLLSLLLQEKICSFQKNAALGPETYYGKLPEAPAK